MESLYRAVCRACTLREDNNRVPLVNALLEVLCQCLISIGRVVEVGIFYNPTEEWRVPHPTICHHNNLRSCREQQQYVDKRLVVGDDYGRGVVALVIWIEAYGLQSDHRLEEESGKVVYQLVER